MKQTLHSQKISKALGRKYYGQTFLDVHKAQDIQNRVTRTPETARSIVAD